MVMKIRAKVFWVVMLINVAVGYHYFRIPCPTLKKEAASSSETLVSYCNTTWHHNPEDLKLTSNYFVVVLLMYPTLQQCMLVKGMILKSLWNLK